MRELIVIRHGQAEHHVSGDRATDETRLTDLGRKQAALTALRIATLVSGDDTLVYCGPSRRALETAAILCSTLRCAQEPTPALATIGDGLASKLVPLPIPDRTPVSHPSRIDWRPSPQAETWRTLFRRVDGFLRSIINSPVPYVVLVTHGVPHVAIVQWWVGYTELMLETAFFDVQILPCGITRLGLNGRSERTILSLSDVSHLATAGTR